MAQRRNPANSERLRACALIAPSDTTTQTTTGSLAVILGADGNAAILDTTLSGSCFANFAFQNTHASLTAIFQVQGSNDGTNWITLTINQSGSATGAVFGSDEITVANATTTQGFIAPGVGNSQLNSSFAMYRVRCKNGSGAATVRVFMNCK